MSIFSKPTERRTVQVNIVMTPTQIDAIDRIAKALGMTARADVLRAGLESLIEHNTAAKLATAGDTTPDPSGSVGQLNEGSEPS
jgi:hypothetical protein